MAGVHFSGVRIALENLRSHKLRTFLTLLGNIVGTMSVVAVVSLIFGADQYARRTVLDEGTDVFTIVRVNPINFLTDFDEFLDSLNNPNLTLDDRDWLRNQLTLARAVGACAPAAPTTAAARCAARPRTTWSSRICPWPWAAI